jgi:hypothetical protein
MPPATCASCAVGIHQIVGSDSGDRHAPARCSMRTLKTVRGGAAHGDGKNEKSQERTPATTLLRRDPGHVVDC